MESHSVAADELRQFVERIEKLEQEKSDIASDIKDVYTELAGRGYDKKSVRQIIKIRKKDREELQEEEEILNLYREALGM